MEGTKKKLYVERDGFCAEASMLFMGLAMVFCLIGSIGRWGDMQYLMTQVALPIIGGLLFLLFVIVAGKKAFWTTVIPVLLGAAFFVFRAMEVENELYRVGYIFFYLVIAVLYALAFSQKWMKWILAGILALTFLFHLLVLDIPVLTDAARQVLFLDGMREMSVLAVVLSMLFIVLAMRTAEKPVKKKEEKVGKKKEMPPEAEKKPEESALPPEEPEAVPEPLADKEEPRPVEPAPTPAEPVLVPAEPVPTPEEPAQATEEPEIVEQEIVEIPALRPAAAPAPAYPLEETPAEAEETPSADDGAESP